ncbi:Ig-like domain-containing protein [Microbacterium sp. 1.5R]|uniref:Ig-like domain-containing protein n=1 Tax=Microbacterium sp. 1.5R TaxID=1916917 RepID=UPI0011A3AAC5|nr:Ig-like domain-containing protein [Microbacterium sp. 1.5R]
MLAADGSVTFTPAAGFVGTTTAVTYRIEDENGTTALAQVAVTVRSGPRAAADAETARQGSAVTVSPLRNDTPSRDVDDSTGEWVASSVVFPTDRQPSGSLVSDDGKTLTVPGQGRYAIAADGDVTFSPEPAFTGAASPVAYVATDANGNNASSTIAIEVAPITPTAADDQATTPFGTPVTFDLVGNDEAGDRTAPLVVSSLIFEASGIPAGVRAEIRDAGSTLEIVGEGVFALGDDGTVTFTPADGFRGATSPVRYTIRDANGTAATAAIVVTVQPGPVLANDEDRTPQGVAVTVDVLANDLAGLDAGGDRAALDPASVVFPADAQSVGTVGEGGKTLTVTGEGVYTVDPGTGAITFTPEPQFRGAATPVVYRATDSLGNTGTATLAITVQGPDPVARDNSATTVQGTAIVLDVLANDSAAGGVPLDPSSLALVDADSELVPRVTVAGEGAWTVVDGKLVFTPLPDFRGQTTPVTYSVADVAGVRVTARVVVTVTGRDAGAPEPGEPGETPAPGRSGDEAGGGLPATGADVPWLPIGGGLALLLAGLTVLILRRRRGDV